MTKQYTRPDGLLRTLERHARLSDDDRAAFHSLPYHRLRMGRGKSIFPGEGRPKYVGGLLSGFAYRQSSLPDGTRQILAIHIPGDFVGLENALLAQADPNLLMLSAGELVMFNVDDIQRIAVDRPAIGRAMWRDTLADAAKFREWIVSMGHRGAHQRLAYLLCELAERMNATGLGTNGRYEFPMTQSELGDTLGLTSVHVNRTLKRLREAELIRWDRAAFTILDPHRLKAVCSYRSILQQKETPRHA